MVDFKTRGQRQRDRIVAALDELCDGQPVGSVAIGEAIRMEHRQVLKYLHEAKDENLAKPVLSSENGIRAREKAGEQLAKRRELVEQQMRDW